MIQDLARRVQQAILRHQLFLPGARIVVAVSGGPDSVALLHLLATMRSRWHLVLHAAHLDHALREASHEDAECVRRLGARWDIPVTIERRHVATICRQQGWSLEEGARRLRYQFFCEVASRHSASHIAVAHTADDQAETVLIRLVRGTGLLGLGAIPIKRPLEEPRSAGRRSSVLWVVRPLLEVWRREILAYLEAAHLRYREDATNADSRFVRNRIRHELIPLLERHYNPNIKGTLAQLAEQSHWDYACLQAMAKRQWGRMAKVEPRARAPADGGRAAEASSQPPGRVALSVGSFTRQPKAIQRQLLRRVIQSLRGDLRAFEFRHWLEAERLFRERPVGTLVDLPGGVQLRRERDRVICRLIAPAPQPELLEEPR